MPFNARIVPHTGETVYVRKADRIAIRNLDDEVIAVVEIVSRGNKASTNELRSFVEKTSRVLAQGVHLLVVDPSEPAKAIAAQQELRPPKKNALPVNTKRP